MTSVVVGILDRDAWKANTDILVIVNSTERSLLWVPRDLWCELIRNRINQAFLRGGFELLLAALADLGFPVNGALCLRRGATTTALRDVSVTVPVTETLEFWYPLSPTQPIEDGRKKIAFNPPEERLSGERIHQWVGARLMVNRSGSDLFRLRRQQVLLRALMADGFDFRRVLENPDLVQTAGPDPLAIVAQVRPDWSMSVFDKVVNAMIDGKAVLLPRPGSL